MQKLLSNKLLRRNNKTGNCLSGQYYDSQEKFHNSIFEGIPEVLNISQIEDITIDVWRHLRMYSFTDPLTKLFPNALWLTIGDGNYGRDAQYLTKQGADVLATDISSRLLMKAKKLKFIKKYKKENAERLSFKDKSFDYVLCKESYHHFPRPICAVYEMLRVARKAVVLIEPNDVSVRGFSWKRFWSVEDLNAHVNNFEISGNYVYQISRREVEKVALGIGLPAIAFSGFDDIYIESATNDKVGNNSFEFRKIKISLWFLNMLYKIGMRDRSLLVSILFKEKPSTKLIDELGRYGYKIKILPKNPFLK